MDYSRFSSDVAVISNLGSVRNRPKLSKPTPHAVCRRICPSRERNPLMTSRCDLSDEAWTLVADLFIAPQRKGQPHRDDRQMLNGILWVLCSGAPWRDLPRRFDKPKYTQRNIIERMFGWLKGSRRIGTRYDKLAESFAAMVSLACSMRCLKQLVSYTA